MRTYCIPVGVMRLLAEVVLSLSHAMYLPGSFAVPANLLHLSSAPPSPPSNPEYGSLVTNTYDPSRRQLGLQPSEEIVLPSSHSSFASITPFVHGPLQLPGHSSPPSMLPSVAQLPLHPPLNRRTPPPRPSSRR